MKRRWIAAIGCYLLLLWVCVLLAGNFDLLMTQGQSSCTLRVWVLLSQMTPRAVKLLLVLALASALFVLWALFGHSYLNYRSDMYEVVPGFKIPLPAGQGQHGTAWFLPTNQYADCFAAVNIEGGVTLPPELEARYARESEELANAGG